MAEQPPKLPAGDFASFEASSGAAGRPRRKPAGRCGPCTSQAKAQPLMRPGSLARPSCMQALGAASRSRAVAQSKPESTHRGVGSAGPSDELT